MKQNSGKEFELTTLKIVRELNPSVEVHYDVELMGQLSKTKRQIDIIANPNDFDFLQPRILME